MIYNISYNELHSSVFNIWELPTDAKSECTSRIFLDISYTKFDCKVNSIVIKRSQEWQSSKPVL